MLLLCVDLILLSGAKMGRNATKLYGHFLETTRVVPLMNIHVPTDKYKCLGGFAGVCESFKMLCKIS